MPMLVGAFCGIAVAGGAVPTALEITKSLASSGSDENFVYEAQSRIVGIGVVVACLGYLVGAVFALIALNRMRRLCSSIGAFVFAGLFGALPVMLILGAGPYNSAGDGGFNLIPMFLLLVACGVGLLFFLCSVISIFLALIAVFKPDFDSRRQDSR